MSTSNETGFRELDRRSNHGIVVALLWSPATNRLVVSVWSERERTGFDIPVDADEALDVFHHPYAYARRGRREYALAA